MNFEQRIAYEIGVKLAHEEYMQKEASLGAARTAYNAGKWLLGFGKGTGTAGAVNRALGSGVGFGLMGAASAEEGLENKLKGFAGGFAGGLAFSGAMPLAGRAGKLLNRSVYSQSKGLSQAARTQAAAIDQSKKTIKQLERQVSQANKGSADALKAKLKSTQESLSKQQDAYKQFLRDNEGVGRLGMMGRSIGQNLGTGIGVVGGMGAGMYTSGLVQGHIDQKQRPLLAYQNNVFNPVG